MDNPGHLFVQPCQRLWRPQLSGCGVMLMPASHHALGILNPMHVSCHAPTLHRPHSPVTSAFPSLIPPPCGEPAPTVPSLPPAPTATKPALPAKAQHPSELISASSSLLNLPHPAPTCHRAQIEVDEVLGFMGDVRPWAKWVQGMRGGRRLGRQRSRQAGRWPRGRRAVPAPQTAGRPAGRSNRWQGHVPNGGIPSSPWPLACCLTKVAAHDAVPGGAVLGVELLLDVGRHVLLYRELVQRLRTRKEAVHGGQTVQEGRYPEHQAASMFSHAECRRARGGAVS